MRVIVINGAPRKGGYTDEITGLMASGMTRAGAIVETVLLREARVEPCRGCFGCWRSASKGRCVIDDDMPELLDRFSASDVAVFSSPLYFYSFSGLMKCFIERLLPLLMPSFVEDDDATLPTVRNRLRFPDRGPKRCVLVITAGHLGRHVADGLSLSFGHIAKTLGMDWVGTIIRPESFFMDFGVGREKQLRKMRNAVETAGEELVQNGRLSDETMLRAALSLSGDPKTYCARTSEYFRIALSESVSIADRDAVRETILNDLSIVMPSVAACYDAGVGGDLHAIMNFSISGAENGTWCFVIENGACKASEDRHPAPDTTVSADIETWLSLLRGELDGRQAMVDGRLKLEGNARLFQRFGRLFPRPSF